MTTATNNKIGAFPDHICPIEALIINNVIKACFDRELLISVWDGEEWALKRSSFKSKVQTVTATTDETKYRVVNRQGEFVASFFFVHGNGEDVLSDCSDTDAAHEILKEAGL